MTDATTAQVGDTTGEQAGSTPPYGSFTTFWNFVEELSKRGPAPQILDVGVFGPNRSGAARYEMLVAFKFLGLTYADKRPTPEGKVLIEDPTPERLRERLEIHYAPVIALGLETATQNQLNEVLRSMGAKEASTLRKARTFFLHAADKAGIPIGNHLKTKAPTTSGARPARPKPRPRGGGGPGGAGGKPTTGGSAQVFTVSIPDAGTATLALDINFFTIKKEHRDSLLKIVDDLKDLGVPVTAEDPQTD